MAKELLMRCNVCGFTTVTQGYEQDRFQALRDANMQHSRQKRCGFNMHQVEVLDIESEAADK